MKIPRLFVPLAKEPYNWFIHDRKEWELRKYGRQYTEKNIQIGKVVELRCGYNNPSKAIWGVIEEIRTFDSINNVFRSIDYKKIISGAINLENAIDLSTQILRLKNCGNNKLIAFKVRLIDQPQFIEMSSEFYELIKSGKKKSTIRKGVRDYKAGKAIIYFKTNSLVVSITQIRILGFSEITVEDARKDGFNSFKELENALKKFYGEIDKNEIMTIATIEIEKVEDNKNVNSYYL
ncbi:ASCH domain-containing protein [Anaerobacterium chartisolvens]|uniref:ASCH domain-containing protein n=1 Tax=Anaerobacterium chartisolvens TaxID=1297424 RepID=A0A369BD77_9FIRM|nr:ASCH domain-containing protein [Anaerobacterium chartisolvens]RCX19509.1 ASCH domain-containing protein [Anaerobacterium chartisolvens]